MKFLCLNIILVLLVANASARGAVPASRPKPRVDVRLVTDEADAVLEILHKRQRSRPITESDWQRLFSSEGYVRLKKREAAMQRPFEDAEFKSFVLSDELIRRADLLSATLAKWRAADTGHAARRALAYLPRNAKIQAKIYPTIKPRPNSFVFEVDSDPAIFLYIDPEVTKEQFENTVAHEFHHIGYGTTCPSKTTEKQIEALPANQRTMLKWLSAFGEGFAMLAAAGGPSIHPHQFSKPRIVSVGTATSLTSMTICERLSSSSSMCFTIG